MNTQKPGDTSGRPDCFDFAMEFLGDPEEPLVRAYVERLESEIYRLRRLSAAAAMPILWNHDQDRQLGFVKVVDGELHVRFTSDVKMTREMVFQIFGNAGLQVVEATEESGVVLIQSGRILEWSL